MPEHSGTVCHNITVTHAFCSLRIWGGINLDPDLDPGLPKELAHERLASLWRLKTSPEFPQYSPLLQKHLLPAPLGINKVWIDPTASEVIG